MKRTASRTLPRAPERDPPWQLTLWNVVAPLANALARAGELLLHRAEKPTNLRPPPTRIAPRLKRRPSAGRPTQETRGGLEARRSEEQERNRTPAHDDPDRPHPRRHGDADLAALRAELRGLRITERYAHVTQHMLAHYNIRVRKWRSASSGIAWYVTYRGGRVQRLLESPKPKGPMSFAIFLHEVGHHAIGFRVHRPRCLEEYHAWKFALDTLEALGFEITESVAKRRHNSLRYAVGKATRRGIREVPPELAEFVTAPRR